MGKVFLWFSASLFFLHCSTFQTYLQNRVLDTADIFTLSVEQNVTGINIKPCFGNIGIQYAEKGRGYGLRSGTIGAYRTGANMEYYNSGNSYILLNSVHHYPEKMNFRNNKIKSFSQSTALGLITYDWDGYNFLTQCEASIGLYYGIRLGFNVPELGDWLLGWTTIDFLDDDLP